MLEKNTADGSILKKEDEYERYFRCGFQR
jgi:hypothetical protein